MFESATNHLASLARKELNESLSERIDNAFDAIDRLQVRFDRLLTKLDLIEVYHPASQELVRVQDLKSEGETK